MAGPDMDFPELGKDDCFAKEGLIAFAEIEDFDGKVLEVGDVEFSGDVEVEGLELEKAEDAFAGTGAHGDEKSGILI